MNLTLSVSPETFAVCRLEANATIPEWIDHNSFFSITRTKDELSVVCLEKDVPAQVKSEKNWRMFKVEGPLDFALTGILASLAQPLADAKISIFAISTYDTDYLLVKDEKLQAAFDVLGSFCHIQR